MGARCCPEPLEYRDRKVGEEQTGGAADGGDSDINFEIKSVSLVEMLNR